MKIVIKKITDPLVMEKLWNEFCKPKVIWDLWYVRKIFMDVTKYPIRFMAAYEGEKVVGVLPIWFNKNEKQFEWISGWWAEYSRPFVKDKKVLNLLLKQVKGKMVLDCMEHKHIKYFPKGIKPDHCHFGLDLKKVDNSWEKYLMGLKKKKRQNIRRDIRAVLNLKPKFRYDEIKDLKALIKLNIKQMRRKVSMYNDEEISVFESDKNQEKFFFNLWKKSGHIYKTRIITLLVRNKIVACDFALIYKSRYYSLLGGADVSEVSGIGNFMNYVDIQDAIENRCDYVDFMMEEHYWKREWFKAEKRYKYIQG